MIKINSMSELKKELKNNRIGVFFKTIENENWAQQVGKIRQVGENGIVQSNAFTLTTDRGDKIVDSWLYFNDYTLKNGLLESKDTSFGNVKMEVYKLENRGKLK